MTGYRAHSVDLRSILRHIAQSGGARLHGFWLPPHPLSSASTTLVVRASCGCRYAEHNPPIPEDRLVLS